MPYRPFKPTATPPLSFLSLDRPYRRIILSESDVVAAAPPHRRHVLKEVVISLSNLEGRKGEEEEGRKEEADRQGCK